MYFKTYLMLLSISGAVQAGSTQNAPTANASTSNASTANVTAQNTTPTLVPKTSVSSATPAAISTQTSSGGSSTTPSKAQPSLVPPSNTSSKSQISEPIDYNVNFLFPKIGFIETGYGDGINLGARDRVKRTSTVLALIFSLLQSQAASEENPTLKGLYCSPLLYGDGIHAITIFENKNSVEFSRYESKQDGVYKFIDRFIDRYISNREKLYPLGSPEYLISEYGRDLETLKKLRQVKLDTKPADFFLKILKIERLMNIINDSSDGPSRFDEKSMDIAYKEADKAITNLAVEVEDPKLGYGNQPLLLQCIKEFIYYKSLELVKTSSTFRKKSALLARNFVARGYLELFLRSSKDYAELVKQNKEGDPEIKSLDALIVVEKLLATDNYDQDSLDPMIIAELLIFKPKTGTKIIEEILSKQQSKTKIELVKNIRDALGKFRADIDISKPKAQAFRQNLNNLVFRFVVTAYKDNITKADQDFMAVALIHVAYLYLGKVMQVDRTKPEYIYSFDIKLCLEDMLNRASNIIRENNGPLSKVVDLLTSISSELKIYSIYPSAKTDNKDIGFSTNIKDNLNLVTDIIKETYNDAWYKLNRFRLPLTIPTPENVQAVIKRFVIAYDKSKSSILKIAAPATKSDIPAVVQKTS